MPVDLLTASIVEANPTPDITIAVPIERLGELLATELKLNALENGGVDNWDWYGDSLNDAGFYTAAARVDTAVKDGTLTLDIDLNVGKDQDSDED